MGLRKCICGNKKPKLNLSINLDPPKKIRGQFWQVICQTCGASGSKRPTQKSALECWNNPLTSVKRDLEDSKPVET